jgi:hypothetical protein
MNGPMRVTIRRHRVFLAWKGARVWRWCLVLNGAHCLQSFEDFGEALTIWQEWAEILAS